MGRRIVGIVLLLAFLISGYLLWKQRHDTQELANGDVHCEGCMTTEEHARFVKEDAGETGDGQSERKNKTARQEAATDFQDVSPAVGGVAADSGQASAAASLSTDSAGMRNVAGPQGAQPAQPFAQGSKTVTPGGDSLSPNSQNGSHLVGTGTFQWYRQGNLTWRVDTATGRSCIIYATLEEWRKPIVMNHGCGRNA